VGQDTELISLATRDQVLAATGHHPYARLTSAGRHLRAYRDRHVVAWAAEWSRGTVAAALGDAVAAVRLLSRLASTGLLAGVRRVNLPRIDHDILAAHLPVADVDDWDFRWTAASPPARPGQDRVCRLRPDDGPAIESLLERAFPSTFTRPGDPAVRHWYGVWDADRLVACGADRSRGGVGSISAVAVDPDRRGQGLGGALTAAMTRQMLTEHDVVTLGVMTDNHHAGRMYRRLGFTEASPRTSADLVP
jgi:N-acetylglutamate synthase-like GNAT family acetyltransferase